jgi:hypothetical protein
MTGMILLMLFVLRMALASIWRDLLSALNR